MLAIWLRSRVPLTVAHVQHLTGAARDKCKQWLDAMTVEGVLEAEVADDGEMLWAVRGAERPRSGPETVAELERLDALTKQVASAPRALARPARGGELARQGGDEKSVVGSGVLSAVLGPLGWLYAAPLREAVPGVAVYIGLYSFPSAFLAGAGARCVGAGLRPGGRLLRVAPQPDRRAHGAFQRQGEARQLAIGRPTAFPAPAPRRRAPRLRPPRGPPRRAASRTRAPASARRRTRRPRPSGRPPCRYGRNVDALAASDQRGAARAARDRRRATPPDGRLHDGFAVRVILLGDDRDIQPWRILHLGRVGEARGLDTAVRRPCAATSPEAPRPGTARAARARTRRRIRPPPRRRTRCAGAARPGGCRRGRARAPAAAARAGAGHRCNRAQRSS